MGLLDDVQLRVVVAMIASRGGRVGSPTLAGLLFASAAARAGTSPLAMESVGYVTAVALDAVGHRGVSA